MISPLHLYFAAGMLAISASLVGIFVILRRMALVTDALSHVALPGLALGLIYHFNPFWGALLALVLAALLVLFIQKRTLFASETVVGILFTAALALGTLMTPDEHLVEALFGDIEQFSQPDFWLLVFGGFLALVIVFLFWRGFTRTMFSEDIAVSEGVPVRFFEVVWWGVLVLLVAIGIKIVGSLLMGALIILPAASARNIAKSLRPMALFSVLIGVTSAIGGLAIANYFDTPPGPTVILLSLALFLVSFVRG